ncbi:ATP-binding protein, partial [Enterobacteriaceae bacterium LUAb1]
RRLRTLMTAFDLTASDRDILLAALLPKLSSHYAVLPDSGFRDGICRQLLTCLFSGSSAEYQRLQLALHPASPLLQFQLLSVEKSAGNGNVLPAYTVSESVWHFFCGHMASEIGCYSYLRRGRAGRQTGYPAAFAKKMACLSLEASRETPPVVILAGHERHDGERALATLLAEYHRMVLCVDMEALSSLPEAKQYPALVSIVRDARLDNAVLLLEPGAELATGRRMLSVLERLLLQVQLPVFVLPEAAADIPVFTHLSCVHFSMPLPDRAEKLVALQAAWPIQSDQDEGVQPSLHGLAARYSFHPADVSQLMQEADYYRQIRGDDALLAVGDLRQTLAYRSRKNFGKLAQRITPVRTFADLILSPELHAQLNEILAAIRLCESVTQRHFSHKTGGKTGLSALFHGESGTGKTLAAEVLAQHLGTDLIKVDLSAVVNKYIGETEKNLARIFDLAQADSGVLFFDEADALFGKRSETKDAHDRHANIEVSYLLQRLESYPGLVILATNNRNHLDSAFNRRFTFIIRFTYPDAALRTQMWQSIWPASLALASDVDFAVLAAQSELTGANIRNVALLAAVLAADEACEKIHLHHIKHAVSRELSKLGRLPHG